VVSAADGADSSATIAADFESRRHADLRPSTGPRAVAHIRGALWPNLTAGSREAPLGGRMAAKNPEARRVLRDLNKELAVASQARGQQLVWSAAEASILDQISSILDRKSELLELYDDARSVKNKLKISQELRLLERAAASLVKEVKPDLPAAPSMRSVKAARAARARWDRGS